MSVKAWPSRKVVRAALRGITLIFTTEQGTTAHGFKSALPWIFWIPQGAICERCETAMANPAPPKGQAGPLFTPDTDAYATFLLTKLHQFYTAHERCKEKIECASS